VAKFAGLGPLKTERTVNTFPGAHVNEKPFRRRPRLPATHREFTGDAAFELEGGVTKAERLGGMHQFYFRQVA
jgi:hypothetical protein